MKLLLSSSGDLKAPFRITDPAPQEMKQDATTQDIIGVVQLQKPKTNIQMVFLCSSREDHSKYDTI